jgi:hypothetical protein
VTPIALAARWRRAFDSGSKRTGNDASLLMFWYYASVLKYHSMARISRATPNLTNRRAIDYA